MPAMNYNSDLKHDGSGAINNSQTVVAKMAVKVMDVLPNRNLVIEGKRETRSAANTRPSSCTAWCAPMTSPPTTPC